MARSLPLFDLPEPKLTLIEIREELGDCERCKLFRYRKHIVFGQGNPNAKLLFVGEAPGEEEDNSGVAFCGRAGRLLTDLLSEVGLSREEVYIANCLKCRPPGNRKPEPDELIECRPFLESQIRAIRPQVIVALGGFAAQNLLGGNPSISKIRGQIWSHAHAKVVPTFHPAYILRSPDETKKVIEDFKLARSLVR